MANTIVHIPNDRPVYKGEIATYWMDDGILVSLSNPVKRTVTSISNNIALVKQITNNQPVPLLIYLTKSPIPDKATRVFSTQQLPTVYKAMAMVATPGLSQLIMNLLFKFNQPPIPMKSFSNEALAKAWLQQYL